MKYITLICFACLTIFSCTKTKYVNVPVHDTTVINATTHDTVTVHNGISVEGKWFNGDTHDIQPYFSQSKMWWTGFSDSVSYVTYADSIYTFGVNHVVAAIYGFKVNSSNDTLWLSQANTTPPLTKVYWRVN